jgi:hypothetical protein
VQTSSSMLIHRKMGQEITSHSDCTAIYFHMFVSHKSWPMCNFSLLIRQFCNCDCFTLISRISSILYAKFMYIFMFTSNCVCTGFVLLQLSVLLDDWYHAGFLYCSSTFIAAAITTTRTVTRHSLSMMAVNLKWSS